MAKKRAEQDDTQPDFVPVKWKSAEKAKAVAEGIDFIIRYTKLFTVVDKQIWKGKKNYTEKYFILEPDTRSKILADNWRASFQRDYFNCTWDAPNQWNRYGGKAYEDDATNSLLSFVRKARAAQSEDLLAAAASGQLEPVYRAVNGQMLTPFVINKKVYAAMRYLIENDVRDLNGERVNKALDMDEYDIPASPKKELDKHQFNVARDFRNEQIENKLLSDANILQLNRDISFIETVLTGKQRPVLCTCEPRPSRPVHLHPWFPLSSW